MELMGKSKEPADLTAAGKRLYRLLASGDLPAAWLTSRALMEKSRTKKLPYATAFNCGLCLYRLEEYEKALAQLKQAEQALGNPPDFDISERNLLLQALSVAGQNIALLPLDPDADTHLERYGLLRVKWLISLSLLHLGRPQEAAPGIRFLRQYHIEISQ